MSSPLSRIRSGRHSVAADLTPLAAGAAVVAVGAVLGVANDWSTGALWGVAVAATLVAGAAFAIPTALRAPSLRATPAEPEPATGHGTSTVTIGARVHADDESGGFSPQRVLVLSGHSRSGKSLIAEQLIARQPGWARASCGQYVRARAQELGIPDTRLPATHTLGQQLFEQMGGARFLEAVLGHADIPADTETLIVDDVYHVAVFEALRERWAGLRFTSVELPESVRRELLHEEGLDDEEVERIEDSPLDRAVIELERRYPPERRITGAARADDASTAIDEIGALLAA